MVLPIMQKLQPTRWSRVCLAWLAIAPLIGHSQALTQAPGPAFPQFGSAEALKSACDQGLKQAATLLREDEDWDFFWSSRTRACFSDAVACLSAVIWR